MQPDPVLVRIGPISVYWYGVLIVTGAVLAAHLASRLSRRNGHDPEIAWNLLLICLFAGVVGARLYHIASSWDYYRVHPSEMFGLQMSGFGIYGAVLGGVVGLWAFCKYHKLRFLEWADYTAPGLLLAQAIGRWGNFFNKELFGPPTDLPWGIYIPPEHRVGPGLPAEYANFEYFHPTFFYESALNFIGFLVLLTLARRWRRTRLYGDIFFLYGLIYPFIRFFIEGYFRPDAWKIAGVPTAQWVSIILFVFFSTLLFVRHRLRRPSMIYAPGEPWQPEGQAPPTAPTGDAA
ncbi:MAG: prolipoprotein diacylglyceryl transferase [Chloroflexi bacterium]|jgi:phosphatidylglycerol:prolipoprotein diacylglycerol transferase|nr:prolipoprotein diacylglyceryl transferase [Chloroflexota bacterium]